MDIDYGLIGKRVKAERNNRGYTQERLAELTDLSLPFISNIENGQSEPSVKTLIRIANALGTTSDALLCDYIEMAKRPQVEKRLNRALSKYTDGQLELTAELLEVQHTILNNHDK